MASLANHAAAPGGGVFHHSDVVRDYRKGLEPMKALFLLLPLIVLSCCGQQKLPPIPGSVKVYSVQEQKGGLVRVQVSEVLPFSKAKGFLCESPAHFENTVECVGGSVKVYSLQPSRGGLYRKQADELLTYAAAKGYFCVSPKDLEYIQEQCN